MGQCTDYNVIPRAVRPVGIRFSAAFVSRAMQRIAKMRIATVALLPRNDKGTRIATSGIALLAMTERTVTAPFIAMRR